MNKSIIWIFVFLVLVMPIYAELINQSNTNNGTTNTLNVESGIKIRMNQSTIIKEVFYKTPCIGIGNPPP